METVKRISKKNKKEIILVGFASSFLILLLNFLRLSWDIKPDVISGEIIVAESKLGSDKTNRNSSD
jgi:hypothetical protein